MPSSSLRTLFIAPLALVVASGCGAADPCDAVASQVQACFGSAAAQSFAGSCSPSAADPLVGLDCQSLVERSASGKGDSPLSIPGVRQQIRDQMLGALREGLAQVLAQLPESIVTALNDTPIYGILHESSSEAPARAFAGELRLLLATAGLQPVVYRVSATRFVVVHEACPARSLPALVERLTGALVDHPEAIRAMGGEVTSETVTCEPGPGSSSDDRCQRMHTSFPLGLITVPDPSVPRSLGCTASSW